MPARPPPNPDAIHDHGSNQREVISVCGKEQGRHPGIHPNFQERASCRRDRSSVRARLQTQFSGAIEHWVEVSMLELMMQIGAVKPA
jgi:hypothetical protein